MAQMRCAARPEQIEVEGSRFVLRHVETASQQLRWLCAGRACTAQLTTNNDQHRSSRKLVTRHSLQCGGQPAVSPPPPAPANRRIPIQHRARTSPRKRQSSNPSSPVKLAADSSSPPAAKYNRPARPRKQVIAVVDLSDDDDDDDEVEEVEAPSCSRTQGGQPSSTSPASKPTTATPSPRRRVSPRKVGPNSPSPSTSQVLASPPPRARRTGPVADRVTLQLRVKEANRSSAAKKTMLLRLLDGHKQQQQLQQQTNRRAPHSSPPPRGDALQRRPPKRTASGTQPNALSWGEQCDIERALLLSLVTSPNKQATAGGDGEDDGDDDSGSEDDEEEDSKQQQPAATRRAFRSSEARRRLQMPPQQRQEQQQQSSSTATSTSGDAGEGSASSTTMPVLSRARSTTATPPVLDAAGSDHLHQLPATSDFIRYVMFHECRQYLPDRFKYVGDYMRRVEQQHYATHKHSS